MNLSEMTKQIEALKASNAALEIKIKDAEAENAKMASENASLVNAAAESKTAIDLAAADKQKLEKDAAEAKSSADALALKLKAAERAAIDMLAASGHPKVDADHGETETEVSLQAYNAITDPKEKARYYTAHKNEILR